MVIYVDTYTDAAELDRIVEACGGALPDFAGALDKQASAEKPVDRLSDAAFADPKRRLWPVHTKRASWLSLASYARQSVACGEHPEAGAVEGRLMAACGVHGITDAEKAAALEASFQAEDDMRPAPVRQVEVAGRQFSVPVGEGAGEELTKIACWMYDNARSIGFDGRHEGARAILSASIALSADMEPGIADTLRKSAGLADYDDESITRGLRGRMLRVNDFDGFRDSVGEKFAGLSFVDACRLVEKIDKQAGLDAAYGKADAGGLDMPEESLTETVPPEVPQVADKEVAPGISRRKLHKKASDVAAVLGIRAGGVEELESKVASLSPDGLQAVRSILG